MPSATEAAILIRKRINDGAVVISPAVWRPIDGTASKRWYFVAATADQNKQYRADRIEITDEADRASVIAALVAGQPSITLHDCDDELYFARICEALWPGEDIADLRKQIEIERGIAAATKEA